MTNKEALEICKEIYKDRNTSLASAKEIQGRCDEDTKHIWDEDIDYLQTEVNLYERIIQDLEMLELIKERLIHNIFGNIVFVDNLKLTKRIDENGNTIYIDEDKYKIMEWLENEKDN